WSTGYKIKLEVDGGDEEFFVKVPYTSSLVLYGEQWALPGEYSRETRAKPSISRIFGKFGVLSRPSGALHRWTTAELVVGRSTLRGNFAPPLSMGNSHMGETMSCANLVNTYKNEVGASEPQEDFDDRNALFHIIRTSSLILGSRPTWSCH
ncbi:Fructosamine kinase-domain-containing protein, partial [Apiospora kogelbergensis]